MLEPYQQIKAGVDLRQFITMARNLDCTIRYPRRTGEIEFSHPLMERPLRLNSRRKSTERRAVVWLRSLKLRYLRPTTDAPISGVDALHSSAPR